MISKYLGVEENVLLDNEVNMFNIFVRIYKNNEKIYIFSKLRRITSIWVFKIVIMHKACQLLDKVL